MANEIKEMKTSISSSALSDHMRLERPRRVQMNIKDFNRGGVRNWNRIIYLLEGFRCRALILAHIEIKLRSLLTAAEVLQECKDLIRITSSAYIRSVEKTGIEDTSATKILKNKE